MTTSLPRRSWALQASLLAGVTVVVSGGNYAFSLVMARLLRPGQFATFSAAQGLLLVLGNGCMAAIPWAVARYIATSPGSRVKQEALHFGLSAAAVQGLIAGPIAGVVLGLTGNLTAGLVTGIAAAALSLVAAPIGFLQGEERVAAIAYARVLEWVVRVGVGLGAVLLLRRTAASALCGYAAGSAVVVVIGLVACRRGFPLRRGGRSLERALVRQSVNLGGIQLFVAMLAALDTVSALASNFSPQVDAGYQAAALLGRVPLFLSAAIGLAAFVHLSRADEGDDLAEQLSKALSLYAVVAIPCILVCWTVPAGVLHHLFPSRYVDVSQILKYTSISGAAVGWMNVVSTAHQARGRFRPALIIMGTAACAQPILLVTAGRTLGIWAFTITLVAVSVAGAVALTIDARRWLRFRVSLRSVLVFAALSVLMGFGAKWPTVWAAATAVACGVTLLMLRSKVRGANAAG